MAFIYAWTIPSSVANLVETNWFYLFIKDANKLQEWWIWHKRWVLLGLISEK